MEAPPRRSRGLRRALGTGVAATLLLLALASRGAAVGNQGVSGPIDTAYMHRIEELAKDIVTANSYRPPRYIYVAGVRPRERRAPAAPAHSFSAIPRWTRTTGLSETSVGSRSCTCMLIGAIMYDRRSGSQQPGDKAIS